MTIPEELEDSAKIDGASDLRILFTIVIPLVEAGARYFGALVRRRALERVVRCA